MWVLAADDGFFCMTMPSRGTNAGRLLLRDYDGSLMTDAYVVYKKLAEEAKQDELALGKQRPWKPGFELYICWSHARRPFEKASHGDDDAEIVLDLIAKLYAVERRAKNEAGGDPEELRRLRMELRASESAGIIKEIDTWRKAQVALPKTKMADGLRFLKNQWAGLTGFLENPEVPLDNNLAERAVRTPVLGRKNHLGSRSPKGAEVSAIFYSLLGSCRLVGVSPSRYLTVLVERRLRDEHYVMLPHEFAAELAAAASGDEADSSHGAG